MRKLAGAATTVVLVLALVLPAGAHHRSGHRIPPGQVSTTSTTQPATTTSTAPTTTTQPSTTTTVAPTTTVPVTTTTTGGQIPSGPIVVTTGGVIEGRHFTGSGGRCVDVRASNVTIRGNRFTNCHQGIYALTVSNITVTGNTFEADQEGRGRNAVQFDKVQGGRIANNTITALSGATLAEDHISVYDSQGTQANPIIVENNHITGGGDSNSGTCILLGDGGFPSVWQVARANTCINPGQVGIAIAGGQNMTITGNTITSSQFPWSNVGVYVWNQYGGTCSGHRVTDNTVSWVSRTGNSNPFWDGNNCGSIIITGNSWQ